MQPKTVFGIGLDWISGALCRSTILVTVLCGTLIACQSNRTFNPYIHGSPPQSFSADQWKKHEKSGEDIAVTVHWARSYARYLQRLYREAAASNGRFRRIIDSTLIGTAAAAVAVSLTGGNSETAGLLGLGGTAISVWGGRMQQAIQRQIYFQGAKALECVVSASLRLQSADVNQFVVEAYRDDIKTNLNALRSAFENLERAHGKQECHYEGEDDGSITEATYNAFVSGTYTPARINGLNGLFIADRMLETMSPLGNILVSKIEEVRILVDMEIASAEPNLLRFDEALAQPFRQSYQSFSQETEIQLEEPEGTDRPHATGGDFTCNGSQREELNEAAVSLNGAVARFHDLTEGMSIKAQPIPAELFSDCAIAGSIGRQPMRLRPSSTKINAGSTGLFSVRIEGGVGPFALAAGDPAGEATVANRVLTVQLEPSDTEARAGQKLVYVLKDEGADEQRMLSVSIHPQESESEEETVVPEQDGNTQQDSACNCQIEIDGAKIAGKDIKSAQEFLNDKGYELDVDGCFGPKTRKAAGEHLIENLDSLRALSPSYSSIDESAINDRVEKADCNSLYQYVSQLAAGEDPASE